MRRSIALLSCALASACAEEQPASLAESPTPAVVLDSGESAFSCPDAEPEPPARHTPYVPDPTIDQLVDGSLTEDGTQVAFQPVAAPSWVARLVVELGGPETGRDPRPYADVTAHGRRLRVVTASTPRAERNRPGFLYLDAGRRTLDQIEVIEHLRMEERPDGSELLGAVRFELVGAGTSGPVESRLDLDFDLVQEPGTCTEHAFFRFGPIPWDMPPVVMPIIEGCDGERCIRASHAWIRTHHNVWRANQVMELLEDVEDTTYRSWLWGQPGLDENHEPVGPENGDSRSSPEFWYGSYTGERFAAIKQAIEKYWKTVRTAKTEDGVIRIRLQCPDYGDNPGNVCFSGDDFGHHWVKGWVNVCSEGFAASDDWVTRTVGHEVLHHVFIDYKGTDHALRDTIYHGHGVSCGATPGIGPHYEEGAIRHLATYLASDGDGCWHRDKVLQTVDAHALFAFTIGEMVADGEMWWWPKHADPTPQPPECVGDPGCLCSETPAAGPPIPPDGDWSIDHYCSDHDGEATCVETEVNAGAIVGICTRCDDERGPGCECNDQDMPCDVGSCFGDDTWGNAAGTGHCYLEPPPSWACLTDCQRLFNDDGAWCYNDSPSGEARCMDSSCPEPTAFNCASQGLVCREGDCVTECGYADGNGHIVTCADLGYPPYMECTTAGRCEYAF